MKPIIELLKYSIDKYIAKHIKKGAYILSLFVICILSSCQQKKNENPINTVEKVPFQQLLKTKFDNDISQAIIFLDSIDIDIKSSQKHFLTSRTYFKKIEPLLSALDVENYTFLNQPNIQKIEEEDATDIKIKDPSGYQVLEEEIYAEVTNKNTIIKHARLTSNRLKLIKKNISFSHLKTYHFLWLFRKAFIRIALTGISGFDSPVLENSISEAHTVYKSLQKYLSFFEDEFENIALFKQWNDELNKTQQTLQGDFTSFDRYNFIKNHTHKQLELWNQTVADWKVSFPFELAITNNASSLFSTNTFNVNYFSDPQSGEITPEKITLGKQLFNDTNLSSTKTISCATCHRSENYFTDGLKISKGVTRNSPTLMYAALQQNFFYDKRSGSLEGQIITVVENKNEFHTNLDSLEKTVKKDSVYRNSFEEAYAIKKIDNHHIRNAIATYIRSLLPFNSKLDRNINALEKSLTQNEIRGFNLFHGKAKCATCHFPPLYNGTVPPDYKETELELIGVPQKSDTINATISKDLGRYYVYNTPERKHFFKTSTVRNINKTAPYMHNGVYATLEEVLDFYNRGGGAGIGIHLDNQTLPPDPLNLSVQEIQDIIAFMNSLEDERVN